MTRPSDVNEAINQALEVAEPVSTLPSLAGPGAHAATSSAGAPDLAQGVIFDEHLALALDEGQNSSNAWRLHDHINHGVVHQGLTIENIVASVIRVEEKAKPELAEVGQ